MMKPFDHEHGDKVNSMFPQEHRIEGPLRGKSCPNLDPKRVLVRHDKGLHLQVLFQRLEEQLNLPAALVDRGERRRSYWDVVVFADRMISPDPRAFSYPLKLF